MNSNKPTFVYFHGFNSKGDISNPKLQSLSKIGNVEVINYNSHDTYQNVFKSLLPQLKELFFNNDNVIFTGTSLGGYWCYYMANHFGVPFIAINPAFEPYVTLSKKYRIGDHVLRSYKIHAYKIDDEHSPLGRSPGMILLDMADDVIDPNRTIDLVNDKHEIVTFDGGSHRFVHMDDSLEFIQRFVNGCELIC